MGPSLSFSLSLTLSLSLSLSFFLFLFPSFNVWSKKRSSAPIKRENLLPLPKFYPRVIVRRQEAFARHPQRVFFLTKKEKRSRGKFINMKCPLRKRKSWGGSESLGISRKSPGCCERLWPFSWPEAWKTEREGIWFNFLFSLQSSWVFASLPSVGLAGLTEKSKAGGFSLFPLGFLRLAGCSIRIRMGGFFMWSC